LRTLVYIDDFNLYYGCLKQNPKCRWLDVVKYVERLIHEVKPESDIVGVKYFSAPIIEKLSPKGDVSRRALDTYLRALQQAYPDLQIVLGKYIDSPGEYYLDRKPIDFNQKARVRRPEEKQTDVSIGVHMISDAYEGLCDQLVLVSNDTDYVPVLSMLKNKSRLASLVVGLLPPLLSNKEFELKRKPSTELIKLSDWNRYPVERGILEDCQLPPLVPARKKPIRKPSHW
jgi:uncharacterized LabA/DUF88 family protein